MATLQDLINNWRILVGETDALNSRWTDALHGIFYVNMGRREFAKDSKALKAEFRQTTSIGATVSGSNEEARYPLDPLLFDIAQIYWDAYRVDPAALDWDEVTGRLHWGRGDRVQEGIPFLYRRVGNSIDLFYAPNEAKILNILGNVFTTDLPALASIETELTADQQNAAVHWAAFKALTDDVRDGSSYLSLFNKISAHHKRISNPVA